MQTSIEVEALLEQGPSKESVSDNMEEDVAMVEDLLQESSSSNSIRSSDIFVLLGPGPAEALWNSDMGVLGRNFNFTGDVMVAGSNSQRDLCQREIRLAGGVKTIHAGTTILSKATIIPKSELSGLVEGLELPLSTVYSAAAQLSDATDSIAELVLPTEGRLHPNPN